MLYLSYDGALDPLGQSQILPYLRGLAARGAAITLISFEKRVDREVSGGIEALRGELGARRIRWIHLTYHKRPTVLATSFDLLVGLLRAAAVVRRERVQVVHARSYMAALMAWVLKRLFGVRFVFDMRGFWADERVEGGLWPSKGFLYHLVKRLERRFLRDADEVVTLTEKARVTIERWPGLEVSRVTVIPTCVDLERFSASASFEPPSPSPVLVYAGSLGTRYFLEGMCDFYAQVRQRHPGAKFNVLTPTRVEAVEVLSQRGLGPPLVTCATVPPEEIPGWLARSHLGLAFYKPGWARQGTCPTKVGEYLAMGFPVVVNAAVGDMGEVIGANDVGVVISDFSVEAYSRALDRIEELWADPGLASRCRRVAESCFSLELGVDRYWGMYQRLVRPSLPLVCGRV